MNIPPVKTKNFDFIFYVGLVRSKYTIYETALETLLPGKLTNPKNICSPDYIQIWKNEKY
jgi:hypothetical protein